MAEQISDHIAVLNEVLRRLRDDREDAVERGALQEVRGIDADIARALELRRDLRRDLAVLRGGVA